MNFVEEARFDYAGGFVYSPKKGLSLAETPPRIRRKTAQERLNRYKHTPAASSEQMHQAILGETVQRDDRLGRD
jgi:tRNA A37 methylthiotransferase MiaB